MEELSKDKNLSKAALKAGMTRKTATKYRNAGKLPTQLMQEQIRDWRTRRDPFEKDWAEIEQRLNDAPELEAKILFEHLMESNYQKAADLRAKCQHTQADEVPHYHPGQLRTFQRRVKQWRATKGPDKEVFFAQEHRPGEAMQTDFTWMNSLGITILGELYEHMLCHSVLPYSNWEWATICRSESLPAIKEGVQNHVFRLGKVPQYHQTDNSSAATHRVERGRTFNKSYKALIKHLGMTPRTTAIGKKEQNGDVESIHGAIKRRLKQHLLLRGSHDFDSVEEYESFLQQVMEKANVFRQNKIKEELSHMRPLNVSRLPDYQEEDPDVSKWSTIRVKHNTYSVPSRLIGERVKVRVYDDRLEVLHGQHHQLSVERLLGKGGYTINYRHIIWSLVRKPGAFRCYRYREALFPTLVFRRACDHLEKIHGSGRKADVEYLRILHLAASTMESEVEAALELLLESNELRDVESVKSLVGGFDPVLVPQITVGQVDLTHYDQLLCHREEVSS
jgi:hypothetical protein